MKKACFSLLLALILPILSMGQRARTFTPDNGLQNTQINSIYQDPKGFVWVCTEGGLLKFDGVGFEAFRHDREKPNSIISESVTRIYEDSKGVKWVGTASGLDVFDSEYNTFSHVDLHDGRSPSSSQFISDILEVPDRISGSHLFVSTGGYGVYVIDVDSKEPLDDLRAKIYSSFGGEFVKFLFLDSSRRIWIISDDQEEIRILDADTLEPASDVSFSSDLSAELGKIRINVIMEDPIGKKIIIGTSSHGILVYDPELKTIRHALTPRSRSSNIISGIFSPEISAEDGRNFLVADENDGILVFDTGTESLRPETNPDLIQVLKRKKAGKLLEDNQGNLWVGIYQSGITVFPKSMFGFKYMGFNADGEDEESACVMSIYEGPDGKIWAATDGAGLFCQQDHGTTINYTRENSGLTNNAIMAVCGDKHGNIWIGTYGDGLFYLNPSTGIRKFPDSAGIGTVRIRALEYDNANDCLYVGTHGAGLRCVDPDRKIVTGGDVQEDYLWVSSLHLDKDGLLWVGTYNGATIYDPDSRRLKPFGFLEDSSPIRVFSIGSSPDGTMWFGTEEGLFSTLPGTREVKQYTENDGLANNVVRGILTDGAGDVWASTANGLSRISIRSGKITNYHASDGLQGNEFRSGSAFMSPSGRLYFGGTGGVTYFSPALVESVGHKVPQVYLSGLNMLDREIEYDPSLGSGNLIDKHISEATSIEVPSNVDLFSIEFSVPEYTNPQRIVYAYRLKGFDSDWKIVPARLRMATYTNVPPGKYQFEAKAFFEGTSEDYSLRSVNLHVEAPWYRKGWAYLSYIVLLSLAAFALFRYIRQRKAAEKEKKNAELKELRLGLFTNLTHEIRTPLNLVMGPLGSMREAEKDPAKKDTYNLMYRNCLRINRLVNQVMDLRKVDAGQMPMHFRETDIVYFIKDIMQSFTSLSKANRVGLSLTSSNDEENLWIDQGNFDKIIYNILSNAFKHTPEGGKIRVNVSEAVPNKGELGPDIKQYVEIDIFNSGSRIEDEYITKIFDRFVQINPYDANIGSGVGLNLTKMLVELHHGEISAENLEDGVVFKVLVPVGKDHLTQEELSITTRNQDLWEKNRVFTEQKREEEIPSEEENEPEKRFSSRKSVVIVEDDAETRKFLASLLHSTYNVFSCANAEEAWPVITTSMPDAVITDLVMPGMNGSELCAKIRKNPATNHIPVIILTGQDGEQEEQNASDSGADKFLSKPISIELLMSNIAQVISARDTVKGKFSAPMNYDYTEIKMDAADDKLIRKIVDSIKRNLENPEFDVAALCEDVGISRVHLNRKLKENGNVPPSVLIKSFRMKQAAYLLVNKKVNISEVAYRVGFSSHSYFSSSFKEFFGMTPREFVTKYIENPEDANLEKLFE